MDWVPYLALVLSILVPLLAWYGGLRKSEGARGVWEQKFEESTREWRETVNKRFDGIDARLARSSSEVLAERVNNMNRELLRIRKWRHGKVDPHLNDIINLNARLTAFEKLFAQHTGDDDVIAAAVTVLQARMAGREFREK